MAFDECAYGGTCGGKGQAGRHDQKEMSGGATQTFAEGLSEKSPAGEGGERNCLART